MLSLNTLKYLSQGDKTFRVGTKEDMNKMLSSRVPDGSFLFRPSGEDLTLCVKKDATLKKYKIRRGEEGTSNAYVWTNKTVKESFTSLNDLVQKKTRGFGLKKDFLDGQSVIEEKSPRVERNEATVVEEHVENDVDIYGGDETYDDKEDALPDMMPAQRNFVLLGTTEDEKRMKKAFTESQQANKIPGTFLLRPSEREGIHTLCIMNKKDDTWVMRKHQIQTTVREDGSKAYSLKKPGGKGAVASRETFPSLEAFIRGRWRDFELQRNFLDNKSFKDMFGNEEGKRNLGRPQEEVAKPEEPTDIQEELEELSITEVCSISLPFNYMNCL